MDKREKKLLVYRTKWMNNKCILSNHSDKEKHQFHNSFYGVLQWRKFKVENISEGLKYGGEALIISEDAQ